MFYLGSAIGVILTLLFIRYVTAVRFICALIALAGVVVAAVVGVFLVWPVRSHLDPVYGALAGAIIGLAIFLRPFRTSCV